MRLSGVIAATAGCIAISPVANASPPPRRDFCPGWGRHIGQLHWARFEPVNRHVSPNVYDNDPANVQPGAALPPGCVSECATATTDSSYP